MISQNDSQLEAESKQLGTQQESSSSAAGYRWVAEWEKHEAGETDEELSCLFHAAPFGMWSVKR
jgi:hypothetical protein